MSVDVRLLQHLDATTELGKGFLGIIGKVRFFAILVGSVVCTGVGVDAEHLLGKYILHENIPLPCHIFQNLASYLGSISLRSECFGTGYISYQCPCRSFLSATPFSVVSHLCLSLRLFFLDSLEILQLTFSLPSSSPTEISLLSFLL